MPASLPKTALITGITGQDGSYLAEFLLEKGYQVHGIKRRASSFNTSRIDHLYQDPHETSEEGQAPQLTLHYGDLTDSSNLIRIISRQPDEIYNLGPAMWRLVLKVGVHRKLRCSGHAADPGICKDPWPYR